jgi:ketosteroid isomerase-like protein
VSGENLELVRRAHAAFSRGDLGGVRDAVAQDAVWGTTGLWPGVDPSYRGPDGVVRWAQAIRSEWESFAVGIEEVLADVDDRVLVVERLHGRGAGSGAEVDYRVFSAYWFRAGRIVRRESYADREGALRAAGLDA